MALYRYVRSAFWRDDKVCEKMDAKQRLMFLYLLTNPYTTQIGIYKVNIKQIAFETGYTKPYAKSLIDKFANEYNLIRYNECTGEVAVKNWGKYNLTRLGKPIVDCVMSELKQVKDVSLIEYVLQGIENEKAREIYSSFLEGRDIENTEDASYVTCTKGTQNENKKEKEKEKIKIKDNIVNFGGREYEKPSEEMLRIAREL